MTQSEEPRAAGVLLFRGALYVHACRELPRGGWRVQRPTKLARDVADEVLGNVVESKLSESCVMTEEEAAASSLPANRRKVLAGFDARGWSGLYRASDGCSLRLEGGELSVIPYRHEGSGLVQKRSAEQRLTMPCRTAAIGASVRDALRTSLSFR